MNHEKDTGRLSPGPDRHDLQSSWNEALRLYAREDWAQSIARADSSAEIAAAIYLDAQVSRKLNVAPDVLPPLLPAAGGLQGTLRDFLRHSHDWRSRRYELIRLHKRIESLVARRDHHSPATGAAENRRAAKAAFENSLAIIRALIPRQASRLSAPR